jgi:hypothetical protein
MPVLKNAKNMHRWEWNIVSDVLRHVENVPRLVSRVLQPDKVKRNAGKHACISL